jgi:colanic acid/amylovoran biosynthesis glycosyltransferase
MDFSTVVVVPAVPGAPSTERIGAMTVIRFRYFFRRWEDLADGAIIENLRSKPSRILQIVPFMIAEHLAVQRWVRRHQPDVLHVHWIIPQGLAVLPLLRRIPALVTTLGGDLYALNGRMPTVLKRAVVVRAAALTTMNQDMKQRLEALGADPESVKVMPMGADLPVIRAGASSVERVPGRMLFVGRLVEKKGLGVLIEAVRRLPAALDWSLMVVGDGPLRSELEQAAAGLRVEFVGQLSRAALAARYGTSEVVVVPSIQAASGDQDGLPVALLEAMGAGCAIVASDLAGINSVVQPDLSGVLVPSGDVGALSTALSALLIDPVRRKRLGAGASDIADGLSVQAVGARYCDLLNELVDNRRPAQRSTATQA